jgi:hypothetical protein
VGACAVLVKDKVYLIGGIYNNKATAMVLTASVKLTKTEDAKPPKPAKQKVKSIYPVNRWHHDPQPFN